MNKVTRVDLEAYVNRINKHIKEGQGKLYLRHETGGYRLYQETEGGGERSMTYWIMTTKEMCKCLDTIENLLHHYDFIRS